MKIKVMGAICSLFILLSFGSPAHALMYGDIASNALTYELEPEQVEFLDKLSSDYTVPYEITKQLYYMATEYEKAVYLKYAPDNFYMEWQITDVDGIYEDILTFNLERETELANAKLISTIIKVLISVVIVLVIIIIYKIKTRKAQD